MTNDELEQELDRLYVAFATDYEDIGRFVCEHIEAILAALRRPEPAADAVAVTDAMVEAALDAQQVYWKPPWRDDPFAPERKADMRKAISAALAAAQEGS